jgi:hypothetical protein
MLVAAELTLAGVPAIKAPDNWPGYDVIAQPKDGGKPLRISVKSRTFSSESRGVTFDKNDKFDWLAVVLLECGPERNGREIYLIPGETARKKAKKHTSGMTPDLRYWQVKETPMLFGEFRDNFTLRNKKPL